VRTLTGLRELNFGAWEGRRLADLWHEDRVSAEAWEADIMNLPTAFGETFERFRQRVASVARVLRCAPASVLVVAHQGSLAVLQAEFSGRPFESIWTAGWRHGEVRAESLN